MINLWWPSYYKTYLQVNPYQTMSCFYVLIALAIICISWSILLLRSTIGERFHLAEADFFENFSVNAKLAAPHILFRGTSRPETGTLGLAFVLVLRLPSARHWTHSFICDYYWSKLRSVRHTVIPRVPFCKSSVCVHRHFVLQFTAVFWFFGFLVFTHREH